MPFNALTCSDARSIVNRVTNGEVCSPRRKSEVGGFGRPVDDQEAGGS